VAKAGDNPYLLFERAQNAASSRTSFRSSSLFTIAAMAFVFTSGHLAAAAQSENFGSPLSRDIGFVGLPFAKSARPEMERLFFMSISMMVAILS